MSSIVTKILSSTVGLLVNKARDSAAAKLSGGDVTDAKIRELVVRELDDVKTKLDGISRKDLLSSYSFLKQGIDLLNASLNKSMDEQRDVDKLTDKQAASTTPSNAQSEILNEALALSQAMEKLNVVSSGDFEYAKKRFEDARRSATHAFSNQALSIEDRLMAAKLHIVATILECLESPEHAITSCLSFLKELHGLGEIAEIFSVYLKRGLMSKFNKAQRVEYVKSVMLINHTLFQFVSQFSREYISVITWPTIKLRERRFNPILSWQEVSTRKSTGDELTQLHNGLILDENEDTCIHPERSAVNSRGDVFVENISHPGTIKIIPKTGRSKVIHLPVPSEDDVHAREIEALAVDKNNNVYAVSAIYTDSSEQNGYYVLNVLDENYNIKQTTRRLEYLKKIEKYSDNVHIAISISITKNSNIVMIQDDNREVFVCDNTGKLKHKFKRGSRFVGLGISGQDEIMIIANDEKTIQIYSEEGNLKSTIKLPKGHEAQSLAFNSVICKIIVLTYVKKKDSFFLLCYTESAALPETEMFLRKDIGYEYDPVICSHPSGACVIVRKESITFT